MTKQRIKLGIATLALAGAGVAPIALAAPAQAGQPFHGSVNIVARFPNTGRVINLFSDIKVPTAAAICGLRVNVLADALAVRNRAICPNLGKPNRRVWVAHAT